MEKQGGRRRQETEGNCSDACFLDVDAEGERRPQKAREELEGNTSVEDGDDISQLPDLLQDKIFSLLDVRDKVEAALVCPSWEKAVYRPCQWKDVMIRHLELGCVESDILGMFHDCLVSLDFRPTCLSLDTLQRVFCKSFISLKKLRVFVKEPEKPFGFQGLEEVFKHLPNLEDLHLNVGTSEYDVVRVVGRCLKSLKQFSLVACCEAPCKLYFLEHLSSLQSLSLTGVGVQGIGCFKYLNSLKKVSLTDCRFYDDDRWLDDLCQMSPLEELKLCVCAPAVEDGLRQLAQGQRNLKVLMYDFQFCPHFDLDLWSLAQMPNLETLSVSSCHLPNDADLSALSSGFQSLKSLAVTDFSNFSAAFMEGIAGLSSLQELSLRNMPGLDGTALEILSRGSCQLRRLMLRYCYGLRGKDMKHVASMSSLRDLTLFDLLFVGSDGMKYLEQGNLRLDTLCMGGFGFRFRTSKPWLETLQSLQWLTLGAERMKETEKFEARNLKKVLPSLKDVVLASAWRM